jgi:hypothetical protein
MKHLRMHETLSCSCALYEKPTHDMTPYMVRELAQKSYTLCSQGEESYRVQTFFWLSWSWEFSFTVSFIAIVSRSSLIWNILKVVLA